MQYVIVHELPGRLRLRINGKRLSQKEAAHALSGLQNVECLSAGQHTGNIVVKYRSETSRQDIITALCDYQKGTLPGEDVDTEEENVINPIPGKIFSSFLPWPLRLIYTLEHALPYLSKGVGSLFKGRLDMEVLDASALMVCLLRRDFRAISTITFFFALGEFLSDWTRKKSRARLAESLALNIEHVWIKEDGIEREIPMVDVAIGHQVVVRTGSVIPVDGTVSSGEALVNQSSMTGEPLPIRRAKGSSVYAGTVIEEGELVITATKVGSEMRIASIISFIENSEERKAGIQGRYERLADAIVPYNFLLAALVFAITRNPVRSGSVLLVDYSCSLRLATPLVILSAMRESAQHGVLIKGGKFLEALSEVDAVVFDKTGTLTEANPVVVDVISFSDFTKKQILKIGACLEEHFVHPVGQAVVAAAEKQKLAHKEEHAEVEFVVAHGIASKLNGQRVLIGSEHFVIEDEGIPLDKDQQRVIATQAERGRSILYLAIGNELAGVILIEDKIRHDAKDIVLGLRRQGIQRIVMLTGDGTTTAECIAKQAGIDEFQARMLPEQKAKVIENLQKQGHKVLMIGDGMNDSPALAAANVGMAMKESADIAQEVADIVLTSGQLSDLLHARELGKNTMRRIHNNLQFSVGLNSAFLAGGLLGVLTPTMSALLHNATTAVLALSSMRPLLPEPEDMNEFE